MATRLDLDAAYGIEELDAAARRLLALDRQRFLKVLALCWAYLSIYEQPPGAPLEVLELCSLIGQFGMGSSGLS